MQFKMPRFVINGLQIKSLKDLLNELTAPVLSDRTIIEMNHNGILIEGPLNDTQIQPNSIDLTLGKSWKKVKPNSTWNDGVPVIDVEKPMVYEAGEFKQKTAIFTGVPVGKPYYIIQPGEFVLMASREVLSIPNGILAFVQGRSSMARIGIQTEQAGLVDAGFHGTITFEVFNEGNCPVKLVEGMRVAQLYFYKAQKADRPYGSRGKGSKYHGQIEPTGSCINEDPELGGGKT